MGVENYIETAISGILKNPILSVLRDIKITKILKQSNFVKRNVGAFPSEGSVLRLLVPLAVDTNAKWLDRKYISWENLEHDSEVDEEFTENF